MTIVVQRCKTLACKSSDDFVLYRYRQPGNQEECGGLQEGCRSQYKVPANFLPAWRSTYRATRAIIRDQEALRIRECGGIGASVSEKLNYGALYRKEVEFGGPSAASL